MDDVAVLLGRVVELLERLTSERVPVERKLALSVPEVADLIGLSESSVRRLVDSGVLAKLPDTHRTQILRADLDRWLTSAKAVA